MYEDTDSIEMEDQHLLNESEEQQMDAELKEPDYEYSNHKIFKIDENMPEELKKQLESFNQDSIAMNELMSKMKNKDVQIANMRFDDEGLEEDDTTDLDDIIEEDNEEIGNLF